MWRPSRRKTLIPQTRAATSTGLAGKIVRFELFPDGVDMYESTRGLVVTEEEAIWQAALFGALTSASAP